MPTHGRDRIELPPDIRARLSDESALPETLTLGERRYWPQGVAGHGYKSVVWKAKNENGRLRAIKFAVYDDYMDRSFKSEVQRAASLEDYPSLFPRLEDAGLAQLALPSEPGGTAEDFSCVFFVEEWVEGETLETFLKSRPDEITPHFLLRYAVDMTQVLAALAACGLAHDDLHAGNVMLAPPPLGSFATGWSIRVVDLGSLKPANESAKDKADFDHVIDHLVEVFNVIERSRRADWSGLRFLTEVEALLRQMVEPDGERRLMGPALVRQAFLDADRRSQYPPQAAEQQPHSPFEFISSEHIASDRMFAKLFASTPWLDKVSNRDPCLLTGPRGCGKSTLFRWLSLKTQLAAPKPRHHDFEIAGVFISCSTELEGRFTWIDTAERAHEHADALVHFFNLVLLRETLDTLLAMRNFSQAQAAPAETPWAFDAHVEGRILTFLTEALGVSAIGLNGLSALQQAFDVVDRERWRCQIAMRRGQPCAAPTPESLLGDFAALLVQLFPFFIEHRLTFLVDDFTARRLNPHVQEVLNRVIRLRRDSLLFKLSSEKRGIRLTDSTGQPLEVARELIEIDIGREYLSLAQGRHQREIREFARHLLDNRLEEAGWTGRVATLLGRTDHGEHGTLAKALRDGRSRTAYHGAECIADLCSGDISTLLLVYREIFEDAGVNSAWDKPISKGVQHQAIRHVSQAQLEVVGTHVPAGREMKTLVEQFGTLVGNVLRNGAEIKQEKGRKDPPTCPRIEVDGVAETTEQLNSELSILFDELVRRAIFVEMEPGLGRHGNVQTLRWQLRRIYLPAFRAALSKNFAISIDPSDFKQLLSRPDEACDRFYSRIRKRNDLVDADIPGQESLLS